MTLHHYEELVSCICELKAVEAVCKQPTPSLIRIQHTIQRLETIVRNDPPQHAIIAKVIDTKNEASSLLCKLQALENHFRGEPPPKHDQ